MSKFYNKSSSSARPTAIAAGRDFHLTQIIHRNEEQIAMSQDIQHFFAIFPLSDSIAQRSAKPVENRGLQ